MQNLKVTLVYDWYVNKENVNRTHVAVSLRITLQSSQCLQLRWDGSKGA